MVLSFAQGAGGGFSEYSGSPPSSKTNISNFQLDLASIVQRLDSAISIHWIVQLVCAVYPYPLDSD